MVVRNVGLLEREVWYTPQQPGISLCGATQDGRFRLSHFAFINGIMPGPVNVVLKPGEELVRWHSTVRHAPPNDDLLGGVIEPRLDLPTGTHTLHMRHVGGDLVDEMTPRDGPLAVLYYATLPLGIATGELQVRCVPPRPQPRRNAPVPKDAAKAVLWSEPVRVDWKHIPIDGISGVWAPDGKSVIVPSPTLDEKGESQPGGVADYRDASTGKVTVRVLPCTSETWRVQASRVAAMSDGKRLMPILVGMNTSVVPNVLSVWEPNLVHIDDPDKNLMMVSPLRYIRLDVTLKGAAVVGLHEEGSLFGCDYDEMPRPENTGWQADLGSKVCRDVVWHPSGKSVFVCTEEGDVVRVEAKHLAKPSVLPARFDAKFRAVAVSPDGKVVAAGGEPGKVGQSLAVIDGCTDKALGKEFRTVKDAVPLKERINGLAFSPDNKHLAAACSDGMIRVFDVATGKLVAAAKEHKEEIFSVAYSPDGKKLLTVGRDAMKVWDVGRLMAK